MNTLPPPAGLVDQGSLDHGELLSRWCAAAAFEADHGRLSSETARTYVSCIRGWSRHLVDQRNNAPTSVDLYTWLGDQRRLGRSAATCNKNLCALRSCYAWLAMQELYADVTRGLRPFRVVRDGALPAFSREDVESLLAADTATSDRLAPEHACIAQARDDALLRVLYATGLRVVSLVRMNREDVQEGERTILKHQAKGRDQKNDIAILPPNTSQALVRYLSLRAIAGLNHQPLWIGLWPRAGSRLTAKSIREIVTHRADLIGLRPRDDAGRLRWPRVYGPHALRRSACVAVVDRFGLEAGQVLLGHTSSDQTRRSYARVDKFRLLNQVADALDLKI